jgi:DNA-binding transcriptional MerR regulator
VSKGPDAFRTISEVAGELNLPQHVLRFWETRFAQIKPLKRGGGRRYYRPDDVELLRGIRHLLYGEGYTIRGVQRILKEQGARFVIAAGHGEPTGPMRRASDEVDEADHGADTVMLNGDYDDGDVADYESRGADERSPPGPHRNGNGAPVKAPTPRLSEAEKERLQTTLSELLELKRLLDQSR